MFICILIAFIVIVTLVIFLNKNNIYNYFYNLFTNFEGYRLGDIYNGNGGDDAENYIIKNKDKFKNTIGYKYIINRKKKLNDIETLNNIIKNHCNINFTNDCIVHIRTGDVLERLTKQEIINRWNENNNNNNENKIPNYWSPDKYINTKQYYISKIMKLKKLNINKVIIISGSHYKHNNIKNSSYFIDIVKQFFKDNDIKVSLKLGSNPDDDLCLLYNSKYFIAGKGGYSRLLTDIVKFNDKIII
jgi:hypothetical protein